jgi:DNA invertase Pin-like site-specific DNA recombinase
MSGSDHELIAHFTEVESGTKTNRPELLKALALCKKHKATLVIAVLDRLARNVAFISGLMESGVKFVAVDRPVRGQKARAWGATV